MMGKPPGRARIARRSDSVGRVVSTKTYLQIMQTSSTDYADYTEPRAEGRRQKAERSSSRGSFRTIQTTKDTNGKHTNKHENVLPSAFCLLPSAFCFLPSQYCQFTFTKPVPVVGTVY